MRRDDNIYDVFTWNSTKVGIVKSTNYQFITGFPIKRNECNPLLVLS